MDFQRRHGVAPPSGLYRASAQVRQAKVVGGWIVLPNGSQVGVVDVAGEPTTAPPLDTATLTTTVNDTTVTAPPWTARRFRSASRRPR